MAGEADIFKINIDSSELNPALEILNKIDNKLGSIAKNTEAFSMQGKKGIKPFNDELKKTDNLLGRIFKKFKLSKLASGAGNMIKSFGSTLGMGGLFSVGGLFASAVMGAQGSVASRMSAQRLNVGRPEYQALRYAGKQTGHTEEQLASTLQNLNEALRNPEKWGFLKAATGLSAQNLRDKDPTQALFDIFDAVKDSPLAKKTETLSLLGQNLSQIGINLDEFREILKTGSSDYRKYFQEYMTKWGGKANWSRLDKGDRALIRFQTALDLLSKKIGGSLAPAMEKALGAIEPLLFKFGQILAKAIGSIKEEDVEKFMRALQGFMSFFVKIFGRFAPKEKKASTEQISRINKFNMGGAQRSQQIQEALDKKEKKMHIENVNINVKKMPSASEVEQTISGIKNQYMTK